MLVMHILTRVFSVVLLAALAASTVAHAADATSMSLAMSAAAMDDTGMGNCTGCPEVDGNAGDAGTCNLACIPPFAALQPQAETGLLPLQSGAGSTVAEGPHGHTRQPDPRPPRTTLLS